MNNNSKNLFLLGGLALAGYFIYRRWQAKRATAANKQSETIVALSNQPAPMVVDTPVMQQSKLMANANGFPANIREGFDVRLGGETVKTFDVSNTLNV